MKRVFVYPCGTEIGLEIYRSLCFSKQYELIGGSSTYDHGRFVYGNHVDHLPFITDESSGEEIAEFNAVLKRENIDILYPAMDGVLTVCSKYRDRISPVVIAPDIYTAELTRSKSKTYELLGVAVPVPNRYRLKSEIDRFPVFVKPDKGQGAVGARKIHSFGELAAIDFEKEICLEFLPGKEYTIDCFTNQDGRLIYAKSRGRKRIKSGISVNTIFEGGAYFRRIADEINNRLHQRGGWFFQMKEDRNGELKLLEVASRIAGTSAISRNIGVNLPLMTVDLFNGIPINDISPNTYRIELDRALKNEYRIQLSYSRVYMDYDDTIVIKGKVNTAVMQFIFQCRNKGKQVILVSKHEGNLREELERYKILQVFDKIYHLRSEEAKSDYMDPGDAIFVDDSYGERKMVRERLGIPVFDTHMLECLIEG